MPLALVLERRPQSVGRARAWVVKSLSELDREDLSDAAELGVSELVTNAILHATPPITVRLGGTQAHPRVEVHDSSVVPPRFNGAMSTDERLLATVGRGLGIVAIYSASWGAEVSHAGKVVWFEPAPEPEFELDSDDFAGAVLSIDDAISTELPVVLDDLATVCLRRLPVDLFSEYRVWYNDLRRELRLLSMNHLDDYPDAHALSEQTMKIESERRRMLGLERLDRALNSGQEYVDVDLQIPPGTPAAVERLQVLMHHFTDFIDEHRLLTLPATREQLAVQDWYLSEFVRQGRGEQPRPWPGLAPAGEDPAR